MAPSSHLVYAKDERVLCFHHELLYEAKVLESKLSDPTDKKSAPQYLVHYKGWKNTWDDWVPQDRLRKLNDENRELAKNLKKEMDHLRQRAAPKATNASSKKKAAGSDLSSTRGSEERNSSVPATGRGQKRGRDFEIEKVGDVSFPSMSSSVSSQDSSLGPSPVSSPSLLGFSKVVRRDNSRVDRSPLHFAWGSPEPPAKRLHESPASEDGKSGGSSRFFPPSSPSPNLPFPSPKAPCLLPTSPLPLPEDSSSDLSSAPPSLHRGETEPEGLSLRRGRSTGKGKQKAPHEICGHAILGTRFRSRNDLGCVHVKNKDYPCGKQDNLMHHHLEYPRQEPEPYKDSHKAIKDDPRANAAKRLFFERPGYFAVIMIAGIRVP